MNQLQRQLDEKRFAHGLDYVVASAGGPKKLSTSELGHLNVLLTGADDGGDPWRFEAASVRIPSGRTHHFNVLSNPIVLARDVIGEAQLRAGNGEIEDAALYLYSQLVLQHLFKDANRRTAMLAVVWLVYASGRTIDGRKLALSRIGDLRDKADLMKLQTLLGAMIR